LYERGALPLGLLKTSGRLNETQANSLRDSWARLYGGVKNSAKTVVLQEGMEYQALSMNPVEIQMTETKLVTSSEICKLFNVPESMISTAANKYGSIEQNQLHFLKHTLAPIITAFESAMDRALLLESEKDNGYFFRFDTSEIVRTTEQERVASTVAAVQGGIFTINEARAKFDLPPMAEGDTTLVTPGAEKVGTEEEEPDEEAGTETD
jgi:HK97 family phage portal protein